MTEDFLQQLRRVNGERYAEWTGDGVEDPLYLSNEFGGEAGEVQNVVKKLVRAERGWRGSRATVEQLGEEIGDCMICLDNLARGYGIDLAAATAAKFNATSAKNGFEQRLSPPPGVVDAVMVERMTETEALEFLVQHFHDVLLARDLLMRLFRAMDLIKEEGAPPAAITLTDGSPVTPDHREIDGATGMQKGYVVLSEEERAKGFVRPVRDSYIHETCGVKTTMSRGLAETYARDPAFYSGTFCAGCRDHFPVGARGQFVWDGTSEKVGS